MPYIVLDPTTAAAAPTVTAGNPLTSVGETLASFRAETIADLQSRSDVAVSPTRLNLWINRAYRHASFMVDLRRLWSSVAVSFVANQPFYLIPQQVAWIKELNVVDDVDYVFDEGRRFEMIDLDFYRTLPIDTAVSDVMPTKYWFPWNQMIVIWPYPTTGYTGSLDFRVRVADMVADTDSPLLPSEFHEGIQLLALGRAQRSLGMRELGDRSWNDGLSLIRSTINTDAEERDGMEMRLQPIKQSYQLYRTRG